MAEITLGLMTPEDVDAVAEIEALCFETPWSKASILHELQENRCARYVVLREDGVTVAYAGVWLVLDEGQVTNIAVHPDRRRLGYGEMVTRYMIQLAADSGMACLELEVRRSNVAAQNLYKKLGFINVGCRKNYYENREDALLMFLEHLPEAHPENDPFLVTE